MKKKEVKLNKNCVYSLEELTSEELKEIYNTTFEPIYKHKYLYYSDGNPIFSNNDELFNKVVNAKELFYTLENVHVDCRELTEEYIENMCDVFIKNCYDYYNTKGDALIMTDECFYMQCDEDGFLIDSVSEEKTTITYEKFMELFAPQYEVKMIVEAPKVDKPIQYQIGIDAIGIAEKNMTIDECLAIARFNITKYSYRKKNQDLEDFKKVIAYANWAIKLLNKK